MANSKEFASLIWDNAEILRGYYKTKEVGNVLLPFCVLRRFDCILEPSKLKIKQLFEKGQKLGIDKVEDYVANKLGYSFSNISDYTFQKLLDDPNDIAANLRHYINSYSSNVREIFEKFKFDDQVKKLEQHDLLYHIIQRFVQIDLHPEVVSNYEMGHIFEELIRRAFEHNEAGEFYTPREVIQLMVNLLLNEEKDILVKEDSITTIYDPACGTGGMLTVSDTYIRNLNPSAEVALFGQEINDQSFALCKAEMLMRGQDENNIYFGNTFSDDGHKGKSFRYMLANPPFGVDWKTSKKMVEKEAEDLGFNGRFGAGTPRSSDGSFLFLQSMLSKMKDDEHGSRVAIVFNGSPLFTGDAGSGESEIRKWIIENDWLEGIVALPGQIFYNTGIFTYIWILTNKKNEDKTKGAVRKGKILLVNSVNFFEKMKVSLGDKRNYISEDQIAQITKIYGEFKETKHSKIFDNEDFGYHKIIVDRPLKLKFQITDESIEALKLQTAFINLAKSKKKKENQLKLLEINEGKQKQEKILKLFNKLDQTQVFMNRDKFKSFINNKLEASGVNTSSLLTACIRVFGERDENAVVCKKNGKPEGDSELRDSENIPLKEDIQTFFDREVKPFVPDAWIDDKKTNVGYDIPFTRNFWEYKKLKSANKLLEDIIKIENEIQKVLEGFK